MTVAITDEVLNERHTLHRRWLHPELVMSRGDRERGNCSRPDTVIPTVVALGRPDLPLGPAARGLPLRTGFSRPEKKS